MRFINYLQIFVKPHLDYGDILYHQPNNEYMKCINSKPESVQHSAALAITGTIKGTSSSKLSKELGIKSLKSSRTFRHLCLLYKISLQFNPQNYKLLSN